MGGVWNPVGMSSESVFLGAFRKAISEAKGCMSGGVAEWFQSRFMEPIGRRFGSGSIPSRWVSGMLAERWLECVLRCYPKGCRMRLAKQRPKRTVKTSLPYSHYVPLSDGQ